MPQLILQENLIMILNKHEFIIEEFIKFLITTTKKESLSWKELKQENYTGYHTSLKIEDKLYKIFIFQIGLEQYCIQIQYQFTELTKQMGPTFTVEYKSIRPLLRLLMPEIKDFPLTDLNEVTKYLNFVQQEYCRTKL